MTSSRMPEHPRRRDDARGAIYLHVPFCARVCPYCDFAVTASNRFDHDDYAAAMLAELDARAPGALDGRDVRTVYVGGGTPSKMKWGALARVLARAISLAGSPDEVTLEANPVDVDADAIARWVDAGVTRVSLGCQSFQDETLRALGRNHDAAGARAAATALARSPALDVSVDLMFGAPGQSVDALSADVDFVASLEGLAHVSAYNLTIEPGTPFARRAERGELGEAGDDECVEMLERIEDGLAGAGFERYEVSSFARQGHRSAHNSNYWIGGEYLGVGVGAHSLEIGARGVLRRANPRGVKAYLDEPTLADEIDLLSPADHLLERAFVAARSRVGLVRAQLVHQFQGALPGGELERVFEALGALVEQGLLDYDGARGAWAPTRRGWLFADAMAEALADAVE